MDASYFNAVGDAVVLVMFATFVSGTLFASTNDREEKSELWILGGPWLSEWSSHWLQQSFGVRLQRFPPDLGPYRSVLCLDGPDSPLRQPRAAMFSCDTMSGNLLFPNNEPERDNETTLSERASKMARAAAGIWPTHFNAEKAKPLSPSLLLQDETQH